jgi:hypothetical protein
VDPKNYLVSPLYGSLRGLARVTVFIGTCDILFPDCRKLRDLAAAEGVDRLSGIRRHAPRLDVDLPAGVQTRIARDRGPAEPLIMENVFMRNRESEEFDVKHAHSESTLKVQ